MTFSSSDVALMSSTKVFPSSGMSRSPSDKDSSAKIELLTLLIHKTANIHHKAE